MNDGPDKSESEQFEPLENPFGEELRRDPSTPSPSDRIVAARGRFRQDWPIWLVSTVTLLNGLLSVLLALLTRFPMNRELFGLVMPFGLFHMTRSLAVVLGLMLIYLSLHLLMRQRVAWWVTTVASVLAVVTHLIHWQFWYTSIAPVATLALLIVFRKRFSVRSEPRRIAQGLALLAASLVIAVGYGTLGFWLLDRRDFGITFSLSDAAQRTLREFSLLGNSDLTAHTRHARWFLESLDTAGIVSALSAVYSLFRPIAYRLRVLPQEQTEASAILARYGKSSYDYFKVWPDKSYFFSDTRRSFVSYRAVGDVAFCLGDPLGPEEELEKVTGSFLNFCFENGWLAAFIVPESLALYEKMGLSLLKIGEEAVVDLESFGSRTAETKYFRYVIRKFGNEGYLTFRNSPVHSPSFIAELEELSSEWLKLPGHREFGFAQGRFERSYVEKSTFFIVRDTSGRLIAFVNEIPSYRNGEATFDMMRHRPDVHSGIMDYLFTKLMLILKEDGYRTFNLGLAPFAGVGNKAGATITERAVNQLFEHLNWFVHSKGLRKYKEKFEPDWEERFIAYQGGPVGLSRTAIAVTKIL